MAGRSAGVVFVLRNEKPAQIRLQVGGNDGSSTEVLSGELKAGDQVIVGGGPKAKEQMRASMGGPPQGGGGGGSRR